MKKSFLILGVVTSLLLTGCQTELQEESNKKVVQERNNQNEPPAQTTPTEPNKETSSAKKTAEETNVKLLPATVVKVVDGDTVKINLNGKEEAVRILLIDTPETVHPSKPVQPFGPEASKFAKSFFPAGAKIGVEIDVSERDKYGRLLAYLWKDGKDFGSEILKVGFARLTYIYPPNTKYVDKYRVIQEKAQNQTVGIWSIENYASEDGFNEESKSSRQPVEKDTPPPSSGSSSGIPDANGDGKCNDIKGNGNSKIYHIPSGQFYDRTKSEENFCSESEAQAAGYRKSQR